MHGGLLMTTTNVSGQPKQASGVTSETRSFEPVFPGRTRRKALVLCMYSQFKMMHKSAEISPKHLLRGIPILLLFCKTILLLDVGADFQPSLTELFEVTDLESDTLR